MLCSTDVTTAGCRRQYTEMLDVLVKSTGNDQIRPSRFSRWVGCAAEVVVAGGCGDDDLVGSGVESAVDEFDAPAGHFADVVAAFAHAPPALASLAAGVIERFFGTLKYEHLYRAPIDDGGALAVETARFRDIYNRVRPHQAFGDRTPRQAYLRHVTRRPTAGLPAERCNWPRVGSHWARLR